MMLLAAVFLYFSLSSSLYLMYVHVKSQNSILKPIRQKNHMIHSSHQSLSQGLLQIFLIYKQIFKAEI